MTIADRVLNHPWLIAVLEDERVMVLLPAVQVAWLLVTAPFVALHLALHGNLSPHRA